MFNSRSAWLISRRFISASVLATSATCFAITNDNYYSSKTEQQQGFIWRNWSYNHSYRPKEIKRPETLDEIESIVRDHHNNGTKLRMVGSGLSPNGLAFGPDETTALSMEALNKPIFIDKANRTAKFQSGMTVGHVVEELASQGLMLENLASINLQQLGGFYQVGAHGTGGGIPPVDEQIIAMTLVTPGKGTLHLSNDSNPELFRMAKLGLGALGVVVDFTVRCVPLHNLLEETRVLTREELKSKHAGLIRQNKHAKYMWVPFENKVIVVTANETTKEAPLKTVRESNQGTVNALQEMYDLYKKLYPDRTVPIGMNFADVRTLLLEHANLSVDHIRRVNKAEVAYHEKVQGSVVKRADETMAFDCGGQQLVLEVAMKCGKDGDHADGSDVEFVSRLLDRIEKEKLPAPIPIEHRFTSGSSASLSQVPGKGLFGWVGIVLYMPTSGEGDREAVKNEFERYSKVMLQLAKEMEIELRVHWAKLEIPKTKEEQQKLRVELEHLFPIKAFRQVKSNLDPKNILGNTFVDTLLL